MTSNPLSQQAQILTRLLDDTLSEDERSSVEKRLLSDDTFYEELLAAETELIDGYTGGEFSADQEQSISHMISLSSHLQDKAALSETINQWVSHRNTQSGRKRWLFTTVILVTTSILLLLSYLLVNQHQQLERQQALILQLENSQTETLDKQRQTEQDLARLQLLYNALEEEAKDTE